MGRLRITNAHKKKLRLTDETMMAVVNPGGISSIAPDIETDIGILDGDLPTFTGMESALDTTNIFAGEQYLLGTVRCPSCHYEIVYYQNRHLIETGFTVRCRLCRIPVPITLD